MRLGIDVIAFALCVLFRDFSCLMSFSRGRRREEGDTNASPLAAEEQQLDEVKGMHVMNGTVQAESKGPKAKGANSRFRTLKTTPHHTTRLRFRGPTEQNENDRDARALTCASLRPNTKSKRG